MVGAGEIDKKGLEMALKGQVLNRRNFGWDMHLNIAATTSKIVKLGSGADTLINVDSRALADILAEKTSGVQAFLDGKLRVRGNLALSMKLEGLFASPDSFA